MKQILSISFLFLLLVGCSTTSETETKKISEYEQAMKLTRTGQYDAALEILQSVYEKNESIERRAQAEIGMIYVNYKKGNFEQVEMLSTNVIETYPTHPQLSYVLFLRAMSLQLEGENEIAKLFEQHIPSGQYPEKLRDAYNEFSKLIKLYPDTAYAAEAHKRLPPIRDNLAYFELHIAKYYLVQNDYEEVLKRARYVNEYYDSRLVRKKALNLMKKAYVAMDNKQQVKKVEQALQGLNSEAVRN